MQQDEDGKDGSQGSKHYRPHLKISEMSLLTSTRPFTAAQKMEQRKTLRDCLRDRS